MQRAFLLFLRMQYFSVELALVEKTLFLESLENLQSVTPVQVKLYIGGQTERIISIFLRAEVLLARSLLQVVLY